MTSKLVVNTIEADTGISSVSFASSISLSSTSKFFFSDAGIDIGADTNINRPATGVIGFNINSGEKVRIQSNGRVGIGTDAPLTALDVRGTTHALGNGGAALVWGNTTNLGTLSYSGTDAVINASNNLLFNVNGAERVRITNDGHIGIGISTPNVGGFNADAKVVTLSGPKRGILELRGHIAAADTIGSIRFLSTNDTEAEIKSVTDSNGDNGDLRFETNGGERVRITSSGDTELRNNVAGINDSYSQYLKFRTTQSNGQSAITGAIRAQGKSNWGGELAFYSKPANGSPNDTVTENLRITSSGILLLGTSTPTNNTRLGNKFGIAGTTAYTGMSITNYAGTNVSAGPMIDFNRSRGTSDGSLTTVAANDKLGELIFRGSNGSAFADAVTLRGYAGTVSGSNVNGVYEISTSNAGSMTVRFRVDENGYVKKPAHPAFFVTMNGGDQTTAAANIMPFDTVVHNNGGHYKTSGSDIYNFVCPVAGYYFFGGQVWLKHGAGTGNNARWEIWRDTTIVALAGWHQNGVNLNDHQSATSVTIYCDAGAKVYMEADYALSYWRGGPTNPHTFFHGHFIG